MTINIRNREFSIEATGMKHIAYKLRAGNEELTGVRNVVNPNLIIVLDRRSQKVGAFTENNFRTVETI